MTFCNFHSQLSLRRKGGSPNSYDTAGRLAVVSDGTNTAAYSYVANSPLVDHIAFAHSGTAEMTTRYTNDFVNRLTGISSALNFAYQYNLAGQRVSVTNGDGSYWTYGYDALPREKALTRRASRATAAHGGRNTANNTSIYGRKAMKTPNHWAKVRFDPFHWFVTNFTELPTLSYETTSII